MLHKNVYFCFDWALHLFINDCWRCLYESFTFFFSVANKNNINNNMSKHESNILLYNGDVKAGRNDGGLPAWPDSQSAYIFWRGRGRRNNSREKASFIGNKSKSKWCHYSIEIYISAMNIHFIHKKCVYWQFMDKTWVNVLRYCFNRGQRDNNRFIRRNYSRCNDTHKHLLRVCVCVFSSL